MDGRNMVHMPDPENPVPLPAFNNQPFGNSQLYPQLPQPELPYPLPGAMQPPPEPSQNPSGYPSYHMSQYPPQTYAPTPDISMPAGYPPQNPMQYPPENQMSYPPQPGYHSHPTAPFPASASFDESVGAVDLKEGLLSRGGEMMNLGK